MGCLSAAMMAGLVVERWVGKVLGCMVFVVVIDQSCFDLMDWIKVCVAVVHHHCEVVIEVV